MRLPLPAHRLVARRRAPVRPALLAPAQTPAPVVARLARAVRHALDSPELQARHNTMELLPLTLDADGFAALLRTEVPGWRDFLARTGIRIDE